MSSCGSYGYVAPQILLHEGYTNKADIFSVLHFNIV
jgi:serine/threonine protein kinase